MIINRHNYEELFLLYVDNELSLSEKTAVENFVDQHPDLAQELEMLQQATLRDDTIKFTEKGFLYKKEKGISLANYEEYFLLAADNELNEQEITEVENFVLKHPHLQDEFTLLHQTILKPQSIAFAGKEILYRREIGRRIVLAPLIRMSAAAAIIGLIAVTWIYRQNNAISPSKTVLTATQKRAETPVEKFDQSAVQKTATEKLVTLPEAKKGKINLNNALTVTGKSSKINTRNNTQTKNSEEAVAIHTSKADIKPKPAFEITDVPVEKTTIDEPTVSAPKQLKTKPFDTNNSNVINEHSGSETDNRLVRQSLVEEQPTLVKHAVYIETDNDEEEQTLYIGSAEINKNKLKGLFKKAAVFFDKKIKRKDD